jgi:opacity protein-like surface antigen
MDISRTQKLFLLIAPLLSSLSVASTLCKPNDYPATVANLSDHLTPADDSSDLPSSSKYIALIDEPDSTDPSNLQDNEPYCAYAQEEQDATDVSPAHNISVAVSGGLAITRMDNEEPVSLNAFLENNYTTREMTNWDFISGISIADVHNNIFKTHFNFSLGVAGYYAILGNITGTEYPFANSGSYDTLNYKFKVRSTAIMAETRLIYNKTAWQPYVVAGMGLAWNRLSSYTESATNPALSAAPLPRTFSNNTHHTFAYEVGVGVQHAFMHDRKHKVEYMWSLDYRYFNFGYGELGGVPTQPTNNRLHINNINTQVVMLSLNASFL